MGRPPGDELCSANRASAAFGPSKIGKILTTILQKQIREAGCSIEQQDARSLSYRLHQPDEATGGSSCM
jgi:hypothetical protein